LKTKTLSRSEQIDYLLRSQFGTLAPPPLPSIEEASRRLNEARRQRLNGMAGIEEPRPAIAIAREKYEAMTVSEIQQLYDDSCNALLDAAQAEHARIKTARLSAWPNWAKQDLWNHDELSQICCGRVPGEPNRTVSEQIKIKQASEIIARGTLSGTLQFVARNDADSAAVMYNTHRHYLPEEAANWATERFEDFPNALLEAVNSRSNAPNKTSSIAAIKNSDSADEMQADQALAIMARMLAKTSKYKYGEKPNVKAIVEAMEPLIVEQFGEDEFAIESFRKRLGRALKTLG
jgi:hypothetical protein